MPYSNFTPQFISQLLATRQVEIADPSAHIRTLSMDSRTLSHPEETLFFAFKTDKRDGHAFLESAWQMGVRQFVITDASYLDRLPQSNIYVVPDALRAMQTLAGRHRQHFKGKVIGITGSNGKTIVKEWLFQCLSQTRQVVRSPRSYNSQIGVALSLWQLSESADLAIIEAGISKVGEMAALQSIVRPDIGILTHLGSAHDEGFESRRQKLAEKMLLFDEARVLVAGIDVPDIAEATANWQEANNQRKLFSWSSIDQNATVFLESRLRQMPHTSLLIRIPSMTSEPIQIDLPFTDDASVENALLVITSLVALGIEAEHLPSLIVGLEPVEMRLEMKAASNQCTIINDAYNNDLHSLRIAMDFAVSNRTNQGLSLILSDLLQTGQASGQLYQEVAALIIEKKFDRLIGIGSDMKILSSLLPKSIQQAYYPTTEAFMHDLDQNLRFRDELILIKGARIFAFERIAQRLQQKNHHAVLEINLTAMTHNLNVYRRMLTRGARMMAMVKAAGYGAGEMETAKLLEHHGVEYLGVAYADEGISLRRNGIHLPIMVLNPAPDEFDAMFRFQLEPEIYSPELLSALVAYTSTHKRMRIHLKLDTGMHRLGLEPEHIASACKILKDHQNLEVATVFTHLSASDKAQFDTFTRQQVSLFQGMYDQIVQTLGYAPWRHVANSGAIARFPEYHFEMVRLGIGLYGAEGANLSEPLHAVHTFKGRISQIKNLEAGETVGYNRSGTIHKPSRSATINIGYADGLLRSAGNGRFSLLIRGKLAPTIGNICMDMCMVDITEIPDATVGDEVIVFGLKPSLEELAAVYQTISYEVLTSVSNRVKRVYFSEL